MKKIIKTVFILSALLMNQSLAFSQDEYKDFRVIMKKQKNEVNTYLATPLIVARIKINFYKNQNEDFCSKFYILNKEDLLPRYNKNYDKNFNFEIVIGYKYMFENSANIFTLNETEFCEKVEKEDLEKILTMIENDEFYLRAYIINKTGGKNLRIEFLPFIPKDIENYVK